VVAAVARLSGKTYAEVKRVCGSTRGGLEFHEAEWLMSEVGLEWKRIRLPGGRQPAGDWISRHSTGSYLLIVDVGYGIYCVGHAVSCVDGVVVNPIDGTERVPWDVVRGYQIRTVEP
jgi:hypothetical protein